MECIIIAFPKREVAEKIAVFLKDKSLDAEVLRHTSPSAILSETQLVDKGVVICTEHIQDMDYRELLEYLPQGFRMILISKNTNLESYDRRLKLLAAPFNLQQLYSLVTDNLSTRKKTERKSKPIKIQRTPQEQQLIERAKEILMRVNSITEDEAHHLLQKEAMNYHRSLVETAQMTLLLHADW